MTKVNSNILVALLSVSRVTRRPCAVVLEFASVAAIARTFVFAECQLK